jgi:dihydroorotase
MKIHLKNGHLIDPLNGINALRDVFIAAGKIVAIGEAPTDFHANRTVDVSGRIICPGLVDLAVRLREPGYEYLATLESEMQAAIAGGVTSLACPPDTDPPLDEPGLVEMLKYRAKNLHQCHVYPIGALTVGLKGSRLTEMAELHDAGCVAFAQAEAPFADTQVLRHALQYASTFDFPVWLRPQDPALARHGVAHDGEVATRLGLPAIPVTAETVALSTILIIAQETGARIHIARLSSAEGVAMVREAKARGLPITCDIGIHHAHLSEMDIGYFDPNCHLRPPLRSSRDRDALRAGVIDGTIDAICSDHTPVDEDAKQLPFSEAEPGATGVELLLPLTLKWAAESKLDLVSALAKITSLPAAILGIAAGHLSVGATADICVFDPERLWQVSAQTLKSQGKNTPYSGFELRGRVTHTLVNGNIAFEEIV